MSRLLIEIPNSSTSKNTTYNGHVSLLSLNKFIRSEEKKVGYTPNYQTKINTVIASNLENLTEVYEILSSSVVIISELLDSSGLSDLQKSSLQKLFLLNLSRGLRDNPFRIGEYLSPTNPHPSDLANEYSVNLSELEQFVDMSVNFFSKTVKLNENIRGATIVDTEVE